jgi:hypothetical protein
MRVIEKKMLNAIRRGVGFRCDNTVVVAYNLKSYTIDIAISKVYLFGNLIAEINKRSGSCMVTLARWDTNTTRSRLNALSELTGLTFFQKDYRTYIRNVATGESRIVEDYEEIITNPIIPS